METLEQTRAGRKQNSSESSFTKWIAYIAYRDASGGLLLGMESISNKLA